MKKITAAITTLAIAVSGSAFADDFDNGVGVAQSEQNSFVGGVNAVMKDGAGAATQNQK